MINHIYIHIPFCKSKCPYCSFYSKIYQLKNLKDYLNILQKEIELYQNHFEIKPKTIYFGGGTPSILNYRQINSLIDMFDLKFVEEITLEANPADITENFASDLKKTLVNRVSLGFQSFLDKELKILGRRSSEEKNIKAYNLLKKMGFKNISLDFIYGIFQQKKEDILYSLEKILLLKPAHISTYLLSINEQSPLFSIINTIPQDEILAEFYQLILDFLQKNDYIQYELSNFYHIDGKSSLHNLAYWSNKEYLGFGASASSYAKIKGKYFRNTNLEDSYKITEIFPNKELIDEKTFEKEYIFLNLRKIEGINLENYKLLFKEDFLAKYHKIIEKYQDFVIYENNFFKFKEKTYFVSNHILSEFF